MSSASLSVVCLRCSSSVLSAVQVVTPLVAGFGTGGLFFPPLILMQAAMPIKDMATTTAKPQSQPQTNRGME